MLGVGVNSKNNKYLNVVPYSIGLYILTNTVQHIYTLQLLLARPFRVIHLLWFVRAENGLQRGLKTFIRIYYFIKYKKTNGYSSKTNNVY